ncbi:hypothetical protein DL98DRAFT_426931, partial [Cadophora sp. DSE1049]
LNLKNIRTNRLNRIFDVRNAKYTIIKIISSYNYQFNTLPKIHNMFYNQLLRLAKTDPLFFLAKYKQMPS